MHVRSVARFFSTVALFLFVATGSAIAAEKTVRVATLEWPPYTGAALPGGGATTEVLRQALEAAGYSLEIEYRPWKRAIAMAKAGDEDVVAYFPGYHCDHTDGFEASKPLGTGPLGFAENAERPITWQSLDDIGEQKLKIGTVLGYANTDEFDAKAGTGWIRAIPAKDDITNLKKLMRGRIDAAIIDRMVLSYLLATEPQLAAAQGQIAFNAKPLEDKNLHLCLNKAIAPAELRQAFDEGVSQLAIDTIVDAYFENAFN